MAPVDDELEELRRRAYGRQGDIHLDARAVERLRELEAEQAAQAADEVTEPVERFEPTADEVSDATSNQLLTENDRFWGVDDELRAAAEWLTA